MSQKRPMWTEPVLSFHQSPSPSNLKETGARYDKQWHHYLSPLLKKITWEMGTVGKIFQRALCQWENNQPNKTYLLSVSRNGWTGWARGLLGNLPCEYNHNILLLPGNAMRRGEKWRQVLTGKYHVTVSAIFILYSKLTIHLLTQRKPLPIGLFLWWHILLGNMEVWFM